MSDQTLSKLMEQKKAEEEAWKQQHIDREEQKKEALVDAANRASAAQFLKGGK